MYDTPEDPPVADESTYPWGAIVAVGVAAAIVGSLIGYVYGYGRGSLATAPPAADFASGGMTEAAVGPTDDPATPQSGPISREPLAEPSEGTPPPPAPPPPEPTGRIVVQSEPTGALVTVDGRLEGETPVTVTGVSLGQHVVSVARPGFTPYEESVTLSSSAPSRTVTVRLRPGAETAPPLRTGALVVDSRPPGARVLLDGRLVGSTPLRLPEVIAGEHTVRLELEGYRPVEGRVDVEAGQDARFAVTMQAAPASPPARTR